MIPVTGEKESEENVKPSSFGQGPSCSSNGGQVTGAFDVLQSDQDISRKTARESDDESITKGADKLDSTMDDMSKSSILQDSSCIRSIAQIIQPRLPLATGNHDELFRLHHTARYESNSELVKILIHAFPHGLLRKDDHGCLPLHFAARYNSNVEVVRALMEADDSKESLMQKDDFGSLPLHLAARYNSNVEVVSAVLEADASKESLMQKDNYGYLPFHCAARYNSNVEVVKALMEVDTSRESLMQTNNYGYLPLHCAARYSSNVEVSQALIEADVYKKSLLQKDNYGCLPLHYASMNYSSLKVVKALMEADVRKESLVQKDDYGYLPLHCAARYNSNVEVVKALMEVGTSRESLMQTNNYGYFPLHCAARYNSNVEVVRALIEADVSKASLMQEDNYGSLPLHFAARYNSNVEVVRALIEADVCKKSLMQKDTCGYLPLHCAARYNSNVEVSQALIEPDVCKKSLKQKDKDGYRPLHCAARYNSNVDVTHTLIKADVNKGCLLHKDNDGCLPLHCAARYNSNVEVVRALIEADVSKESLMQKDKDGSLALHYVAMNNKCVEVVKALMEVDVSKGSLVQKNKNGYLPLHFAARNNSNVEVVKALIEADGRKESLMQKDNYGYLPLHCAALYNSNVEVVKVLIEADVSRETLMQADTVGYLPLHYAAMNYSSLKVVKALIEADVRKGSLMRNKYSRYLPIHCAARYNSNVEVVRALIEADVSKESLMQKDNYGYLPLHCAARYSSNVKVVKALTDADASKESLMQKDDDGYIPLHCAARYNSNEEVVIALIEAVVSKESLMQKDKGCSLPLHCAARYNNNVKVGQVLIEADASRESLIQKDNDGCLPLHYFAMNYSSMKVVKALIEADANKESLLQKDKDGYLPLHYAARYNSNVDVTHTLIEADFNKESLMQKDNDGCLPLYYAARYNSNVEVVRALIEADVSKASLMQKDNYGSLALHYVAMHYSSVKVLKALIEADVRKDSLMQKDKDGCLPLHCAARYNSNVEVVKTLVEADISRESLMQKDNDGRLPLHYSLQIKSTVEVVKVLIEADVSKESVLQKNKDGYLPLHYAAMDYSNVEVVRALIEADVSKESLMQKNKNGSLPLHCAARYNSNVEVVRALTEADISKESLMQKDKDGCLPLHCAARYNSNVEVVRALMEADISKESLMQKDEVGYLPLHCAARYSSNVKVVKALTDADVSKESLMQKDNDGYLPLHCAARHNSNVEVVKTLIVADASKESLMQKNFAGKLPVGLVPSSSLGKLRAFIVASPESCLVAMMDGRSLEDNRGQRPLENFLQKETVVSAIEGSRSTALLPFFKAVIVSGSSLDLLQGIKLPSSLRRATSSRPSSSSVVIHVCGPKLAGKTTLTGMLIKQLKVQPAVFGPVFRFLVAPTTAKTTAYNNRTSGMVSHLIEGQLTAGGSIVHFAVHDYGGHEQFWVTYPQFLKVPNSLYIIVIPLAKKTSDTEHVPYPVEDLVKEYKSWLSFIGKHVFCDIGESRKDKSLPAVLTILNQFSAVPKPLRTKSTLVEAALTACQTQYKTSFNFYKFLLIDSVNSHDCMWVREIIADALRPIVRQQGLPSISLYADLLSSFGAAPITLDFMTESEYRANVKGKLRECGYDDDDGLPILDTLADCWVPYGVRSRRIAVLKREGGQEPVIATSVTSLSNKLFGGVLNDMRLSATAVIERWKVAEIIKESKIKMAVSALDAAELLVQLDLFLRVESYNIATGQVQFPTSPSSSLNDKFLVISLIEQGVKEGEISLPNFQEESSRRVHRFFTLNHRVLSDWGPDFFMRLFQFILSLVPGCVCPLVRKDGLFVLVEDGIRRMRYLIYPSRRDQLVGFELVIDVSTNDASQLRFEDVSKEEDEVLKSLRAVSAECQRLLRGGALEYCVYPDPYEPVSIKPSGDVEKELEQAETIDDPKCYLLRKFKYGHYPIKTLQQRQMEALDSALRGLLSWEQFSEGIVLLQRHMKRSTINAISQCYTRLTEAIQSTIVKMTQELAKKIQDATQAAHGDSADAVAPDAESQHEFLAMGLEELMQEVRSGRAELSSLKTTVEGMHLTLNNMYRAQLRMNRGMCEFPLLVVLEEVQKQFQNILPSMMTTYSMRCICPVCGVKVEPPKPERYELKVPKGKWAIYLLQAFQVSIVLGGIALRVAGVPGAVADELYACTKHVLSEASQLMKVDLAKLVSENMKSSVADSMDNAISGVVQVAASSPFDGAAAAAGRVHAQLQHSTGACPPSSGREVVVSIEYIRAMKALFEQLKDPEATRSGLMRVVSDQSDVAFVCEPCRGRFVKEGRGCLSVIVLLEGSKL
eukprot:gene25332-30588_t